MKIIFNIFFVDIKFIFYLLIGKIFGISHIIRYLRNPNPLISVKLLKSFGAKIGSGTKIKGPIFFDNVYEDQNSAGDFSHLQIGKNCYIGDCVYFDLANKINIGNDVVISGQSCFVTHSDCNRSKTLKKIYPRTCKEIVIEEGAWIAFRSTILNGVRVARNSVVSAHSLVKSDVEEYSLYSGIPAEKIKKINKNFSKKVEDL